MATIKHAHQTVIANDPSKDVSADAWNEAHDVTLVDGDIPASIARDSEVTAAVAAEATARDTAIGVHSADTTAVHGIADTANVVLTGDARLSDARTPTGAAGGDLGGTYPNPTVSDDSHSHTSATLPAAGADLSGIDFLVGTASGLLSAEIPVGTSPGGELGGTWASPTVDATHSGSSHAGVISTHEGASDPHPGYLTAAEGNAVYDAIGAAAAAQAASQPVDSDLTAIAALTTTSYGRGLLELANSTALRTAGALVIGTDVEAHDADLTTIAGLSATNDDVLQRKAGAWANRTIAQLLTDLAAAGTTFQPLDSDLTSIAALTTTSFGRGLLALADAAALAANHTHAGGGVTQSYAGYNTIGGSVEALASTRTVMKQITLASAGFLGELELYLDQNADLVFGGAHIGVWTDSSNLPLTCLHQSGTASANEMLLETSSSTWPARWIGVGSFGKWLAAGTYWIGFLFTDIDGARIYYDGSGTDRYFTSGGNWSADGTRYSQTDSTKTYSMRVTVIR